MTRRKRRGEGPDPGFTPRTAVLDPLRRLEPAEPMRANVERMQVGTVHFGDGVPSGVTLAFDLEGGERVTMLLKEVDEVDKLIMALTRHRIEVFGDFRS